MVISNQLNGPFRRAHVFATLVALVLAVNVFIGLASLGCAMAVKMTDPHGCLKEVHVTKAENPTADTCVLPSIGGSALTAMAPRELVSVELGADRSAADLKPDARDFFDQAYPDPHERPPQIT